MRGLGGERGTVESPGDPAASARRRRSAPCGLAVRIAVGWRETLPSAGGKQGRTAEHHRAPLRRGPYEQPGHRPAGDPRLPAFKPTTRGDPGHHLGSQSMFEGRTARCTHPSFAGLLPGGGSSPSAANLQVQSWLTTAIPMDSPFCSCKLTRVRSRTAPAAALARPAGRPRTRRSRPPPPARPPLPAAPAGRRGKAVSQPRRRRWEHEAKAVSQPRKQWKRARQRQHLSREGSGNARQRRCLTAACSASSACCAAACAEKSSCQRPSDEIRGTKETTSPV